MSFLISFLLVMSPLTSADEVQVEISGMKCQSCVKNIKKAVCEIEAWSSCDVEVGHLNVSTPKGIKIDIKKLEAAIELNGHYKMESFKIIN